MTISTIDDLIEAICKTPARPDPIEALAFTIMALHAGITEAMAALAPSSDTLEDLIAMGALRRHGTAGTLTVNPDLIASWQSAQAEAALAFNLAG